MKRKNTLLIVDPQNDFVDPSGKLSVAGAVNDMNRVAELIRKHGDKIDDIQVTLDSHHPIHIAHPIYWVDQSGNHPSPFTIIEHADIESGKWRTYNPRWNQWGLDYTKSLENSPYKLCIWPEHCLIGSWGSSVFPPLFEALKEWEEKYFGVVNFVTKGSNIHTEHYGVAKAEVPRHDDLTTELNTDFVTLLEECDDIYVAGEASSHCVSNSCMQIIDAFGVDGAKKMVLLTDATSPVPGFEFLQEEFFKKLKEKGGRFETTTTLF